MAQETIDELRERNQRLREALQELYGAQHAPALMINLRTWGAAMDKARAALDDDPQSSAAEPASDGRGG
jgi:hypothetical protein